MKKEIYWENVNRVERDDESTTLIDTMKKKMIHRISD